MTKTALILLVGEQPLPNLLPTRHINPEMVVLVHTDRTRGIAERLKGLLSGMQCLCCQVEPYDLLKIEQTSQDFLSHQIAESEYQLLFNLTGGTKPMSLAAFRVASQRKAPFVYFQTEGGRSLLYCYQFTDQREVKWEKSEEISQTITLKDYLYAQVGDYTTESPRNDFEKQVNQALQAIYGMEILTSVRPKSVGNLELDFVIRLGNRIGVIETKSSADKKGIDQIQSVTEQRYLGTYVAKFLVSGNPVDANNKNLAQAYEIEVIELQSYARTKQISKDDGEKLRERILSKLGGR